MSKQRTSSIELLRIVAMLFIIAHHYLVLSGLSQYLADYPTTKKTLFLIAFGMWGKMGTNCFILITGYYMCKSDVKIEKYIRLVMEYEFYKCLEYTIFLISRYEVFSIDTAIKVILPVSSIDSEFVDCYLVFYLFIPFLNTLIQNLDEKKHRYLVLLCIGVYSIFAAISEKYISVTLNMVTWFICLYFVASYIKMYPRKWYDKTAFWGGITICLFVVTVGISIYRQYQGMSYWWFVNDCNKPLAFAVALCMFMFFKNVKISYSKLINTCGASCFGVLMIHSGTGVMQNWLWKDLARNVEYYNSQYLVVHAILWVFIVFMVCVPIDIIRKKYLEEPVFQYGKKVFQKMTS